MLCCNNLFLIPKTICAISPPTAWRDIGKIVRELF